MATAPDTVQLRWHQHKGVWPLLSLLFVVAVVLFIRVRLLDMPLERDEGEYAYAGQLMLQGESIYRHAYNVTLKLPGTCVAYALAMGVFGESALAIRLGLTLVNVATIALVFLIARRLYGVSAAVFAAGAYALLSISPAVLGLMAHANHFVMLPALAGILLLQNLNKDTPLPRIFFAGLLLGVAIWMKQSGAAFGLFGLVWLSRVELGCTERKWRGIWIRLGSYAAGLSLPLLLTCAVLAFTGDFDRFWFWSFQFAAEHGTKVGLGQGTWLLLRAVVGLFTSAPLLWGLAVFGLLLLPFVRPLRCWRFFILGFAACSFLAVCPGLLFRDHYFIQILPSAALFAGIAFQAIKDFMERHRSALPSGLIPALIFGLAAVNSLVQSAGIYFRYNPTEVSRAMYGLNPFPEAVQIARFLQERTSPTSTIAVLGSEPQIYFYSHRRAATGHICTYAMMEPQPFARAMQKEMISEIEASDPDYLIYVNIRESWLQNPESETLIFDWCDRYLQERFHPVALVQLSVTNKTEYMWSLPESGVIPEARNWIGIFQNKKLSLSEE